jgi:hypothetical protein
MHMVVVIVVLVMLVLVLLLVVLVLLLVVVVLLVVLVVLVVPVVLVVRVVLLAHPTQPLPRPPAEKTGRGIFLRSVQPRASAERRLARPSAARIHRRVHHRDRHKRASCALSHIQHSRSLAPQPQQSKLLDNATASKIRCLACCCGAGPVCVVCKSS